MGSRVWKNIYSFAFHSYSGRNGCRRIWDSYKYSSFTKGKFRLEDISRRLSCNDWENIDPDLRSPSPEPIYDPKTGIRINTREIRTKEQYVKEKNSIIEELIKIDDTYTPPADYKPPKKTKKLFIPESGDYNFIGLILGPRGSTQRELEKKSGCKISIRGKGSNWVNLI